MSEYPIGLNGGMVSSECRNDFAVATLIKFKRNLEILR